MQSRELWEPINWQMRIATQLFLSFFAWHTFPQLPSDDADEDPAYSTGGNIATIGIFNALAEIIYSILYVLNHRLPNRNDLFSISGIPALYAIVSTCLSEVVGIMIASGRLAFTDQLENMLNNGALVALFFGVCVFLGGIMKRNNEESALQRGKCDNEINELEEKLINSIIRECGVEFAITTVENDGCDENFDDKIKKLNSELQYKIALLNKKMEKCLEKYSTLMPEDDERLRDMIDTAIGIEKCDARDAAREAIVLVEKAKSEENRSLLRRCCPC